MADLPWRPRPKRIPRDAVELQALTIEELEQLAWGTQLKLGRLHQRRAKLLRAEPHDNTALALAGAQIKAAGNLLSVMLVRRGQLRTQRRRALGQMPRRNDAIAMSVDSQLSGRTWKRVQEEADRILAAAAADLAGEESP